MSIKDSPTATATPVIPRQQTTDPVPAARPIPATRARGRYQLLAVLRITMGLTFLWAFVDKTFLHAEPVQMTVGPEDSDTLVSGHPQVRFVLQQGDDDVSVQFLGPGRNRESVGSSLDHTLHTAHPELMLRIFIDHAD